MLIILRHKTSLPVVLFALLTALTSMSVSAQTKAIVMPVDFEMYLLTAGGTRELQPEWTETGKAYVQMALNEASGTMFEVVELPEISDEEKVTLDEHMALFEMAVGNSITMITTAEMTDKIKNYNYSLGPGLAWLSDKAGADKLVVLFALQEISSDERVVMTMLGTAAAGITGSMFIAPSIGSSYCTTGIVDLRSGNIEWANYRTPLLDDMRNEQSAKNTVNDLVQAFPKGRLMRSSIKYYK